MASQRQVALAWLTMLAALAVTSFAAPLRNAQDCVTPTLLKLVDQRVFPSAHQIQSTSVVTLQDRTTVTVAQDFSVTYYDTFKVVKNLNVKVNETYLLYQCGTTPPSDLAAYDLPANTKVLSIPLMSVSAEDTSILYFMKQLGVADRVGYVTSYAVDPCMQALLAPGCGRNDSMATADVVDATFTYGKNDKDATSIAFTATADPGPLNRAEHIKYVAAFFNREAIANTIFRTISAKYDATRQMVSSYVTSTAAMKPLVAWITYFPAYDSPSYKSPASIYLYFKAYRKDYTEDAGARTFDPIALNATYGNGKTIRISSDRDIIFSDLDNTRATLRTILKDVDVLIDESYYGGRNPTTITIDDFRTMYGFTAESDMTDFKFLATQRVLRLDGVATNDGSQGWLEEAVARPDEVLRDLAGFFQPGAFVASNDPNSGPVAPRFARTLFVSASKPSTVLVTSAAQCPANQLTCGGAPAPVCPAYYIDCSGKPTVATESQPCAPTCKPSVNTPAPVNQPGAAGRVAFAPALLAALLAVALAAVAGFAF